MMKKHLFLRFCLMFLVGVSAFSCRTEEFHNEEEAHGNTGLRLTSKRISLNESKHKTQLLTEIDKAENALKGFTKMNVHGKVVNYGNGVSIDTDHVIYIENGANYHTYTFHIARDNAPADAPLENLLLSPLPDGSYQEFLVTYNLTALEKQKLLNGEPVNTKGKTKITELAKGTFNPGGSLMNARTTCSWTDVTIVYGCSQINKSTGQPVHNETNMSDWHNCTAETKPMVFTAGVWNCGPEKEDNYISPGTGSGGGGGGGGVGGEGQEPPDDCTSIATDPSQVGLVSPTGCNIGVPTEPVVRPQTPCSKIKATVEDVNFNIKLDEIDKPESFKAKKETGFAVAYGPVINYESLNNITNDVLRMPIGNKYFAYIHVHLDKEGVVKIFSPGDIVTFLTACVRNAQDKGKILDAYAMVITSQGNYMLKYSGDGSYSIGPNQINSWKTWYNTEFTKIMKEDGTILQSDVEKLFTQFVKEKVNINGLEVYSIDKTTGSAIKLEYNGADNPMKTTPCP